MAASTKSGSGDACVSNPPTVKWAQRKDRIFLTIEVEDCKDASIDMTETTFSFKGKDQHDKVDKSCDLELFGEIVPELHYVKTDFNKWRDEDDSEEDEQEPTDLEDMMGGLNGIDPSSMLPQEEDSDDSDDAELPDLQ